VEDPIVFGVQKDAAEASPDSPELEAETNDSDAESIPELEAPWPVESSDSEAESSKVEPSSEVSGEEPETSLADELGDMPDIIRMDESVVDESVPLFDALAEEPSQEIEVDADVDGSDDESIELASEPEPEVAEEESDEESADAASEEPQESEDAAPEESEESEDATFEQFCSTLTNVENLLSTYLCGDLDPHTVELSNERLHEIVNEVVDKALGEGVIKAGISTDSLVEDLYFELTGLGPVEHFLRDKNVSRIQINAYDRIYVTHDKVTERAWKAYSSPVALLRAIDRMSASLGYDSSNRPALMQGELADGTRYQIMLPPLSLDGPIANFNKPRTVPVAMGNLLENGILNEEMVDYLVGHIQGGTNIVVSGRWGSGRTALLNGLSLFVPEDDHILLVENVPELVLPHPNINRLQMPANPEESNALFTVMNVMRGDRLIVGDAHGNSAVSLLRMALNGVEGILAAMYGQSVTDLIDRLITLCQLSGVAPNNESAQSLVGTGVGLVVQLSNDDSDHRVTSITEVVNDDGVTLREVFRWNPKKAAFQKVG
jgi:pilus assembly protein CpaF